MKPERPPLPIHPALFALFPIASLLSANLGEVRFTDAGRSLVVVLLAAALLLAVYFLLLRSLARAAIVTTVTILLLLSYGHAYTFLKTVSLAGFVVGRHRMMVPGAALIVAAALIWAARHRGDLFAVTRVLNVVGGAALLIPLLSISASLARDLVATDAEARAAVPWRSDSPPADPNELPDIYYIITDAYARSDVLAEYYQHDNSAFLVALERQGFYIARESVPNYLWTDLSLASSLNMDYIQNLIPEWTQGSRVDSTPLIQLSRARSRLEELGYSTVGFATGLHATEWFDADYVLTPDISRLELLSHKGLFNDFEGLIIHASVLRVLEDYDALSSTIVAQYIKERMQRRFTVQREIILAEFENLAQVPEIPGPKFVFVHIISPHGPYLFGPNGEERGVSGPFTLSSTDDLAPEQEAALYVDQLTFISSKLEEAVTTILRDSDRPPIIILQSDHGPSVWLDWEDPAPGPLLAKAAILNAYYIPEDCRGLLYPGVSPVNTFRVIFNCLFDEDLPLLGDETYFGVEEFIPLEEFLPSDSPSTYP